MINTKISFLINWLHFTPAYVLEVIYTVEILYNGVLLDIPQLPVYWCHIGRLKLNMVGIFAPWSHQMLIIRDWITVLLIVHV